MKSALRMKSTTWMKSLRDEVCLWQIVRKRIETNLQLQAEDFILALRGFHPSKLGFHRGCAAISSAKPITNVAFVFSPEPEKRAEALYKTVPLPFFYANLTFQTDITLRNIAQERFRPLMQNATLAH
jgi:hypothetical protein